MEIHEAANSFPMMDQKRFEELVDDIRQHGQRVPITLSDGKILDGRNRMKACEEIGIEPITEEYDGNPFDYVWSLNGNRRDLLVDQRSAIALYCMEQSDQWEAVQEEIRIEANAKRSESAKQRERNKAGTFKPVVVQNEQQLARRDKTRQAKAKAANTSPASIARVEALRNKSPELFEKVRVGEIKPSEAYRQAKREEVSKKAKQLALKAKPSGKNWVIHQADCLEWMRESKGGFADLIFADPPYNIGIDYGCGCESDRVPADQFLSWSREWMLGCVRMMKPDASFWVMTSDENAAEYGVILKQIGLKIRAWVKWYETFGVNQCNNFNRTSRHIFYCVRGDNFTFNAAAVNRPSDRQSKYNDKRAHPSGKTWDDVWIVPRLTGTCRERIPGVPTQIPLEILRAIVGCSSNPGDTVFDPFNGSGSTGHASVELGRHYVGIEKNKKFSDIAKGRLSQL